MANARYKSSRASADGSGVIQSLLIDVRASTQGFAQDLNAMRGSFNSTLLDGFTQAGSVLGTSLLGAATKGSAGFTQMRSTALGAIADIAGQAAQLLFLGSGSGTSGGTAKVLGGLVGAISGLPGRATGGPVSPGQAYLVGERGPELFVPTSAGAVAANGAGAGARDLRVSITVNAPSGSDAPQALQRSSRQVASAVRRALAQN